MMKVAFPFREEADGSGNDLQTIANQLGGTHEAVNP